MCRCDYRTSMVAICRRRFGSETETSVTLNDEDMYSFERDESSGNPWKSLLTIPGRAAWRVTPTLADTPLLRARNTILNRAGRSNKELHKTYEEIVEKQHALKGRRDRERLRILNGREYTPREVKKDAAIEPVVYGPEETLAAFKFRMLNNYAVVRRILEEAKSLIGPAEFKPRHVVDFGIGCGAATAASMDVWDGIEWVHGVDSSRTMREGAETFLEEFLKEKKSIPTTRITLSGHLSVEAAPPAFDLALCSYTSGELSHSAGILAAAGLLWEKLLPGGLFVMVEPGTPDGFSSIRTVRNMLLAAASPDLQEAGGDTCNIISPCTHSGKCPVERYQKLADEKRKDPKTQIDVTDGVKTFDGGSDESNEDDAIEEVRVGFCSFVQSLPGASSISKGEKFSYLVAQKRIAGECLQQSHEFQHVSLTKLLNETLVNPGDNLSKATELEELYLNSDEDDLGLELVRGDEARSNFGRIVSAPIKRRGHIYIDTCVAPGSLRRQKVTKSMSNAAPGLYQAARKSRWGGLFPIITKL